ncbi:MAG: chemotaxis protein CheX [Planctomycetaceae bacterium]|nr:chemotaxis protein CheX [Planctomycetaceae bacterium]
MTETAEDKNKEISNAIAGVSNVIIASTHDAFVKMTNVEIERKSVVAIARNRPLYDVTSVISLTGDLNGTVCLSMTNETVLAMAHRMMGMEFTEVDELVASCVSEFANIIAGSSKMALSHLNMDIGLPSIIRGKECIIDFPCLAQPLCVNYECELGPFLVVFGFAS